MKNIFKPKTEEQPRDVKMIRNSLLQFIKDQLNKAEGGEGRNIKELHLFLTCPDAEKHLYGSAVYLEEGDRFKTEEVQKIADDYAIALPRTWTMDILFVDALPKEALKMPDLHAGLFIETQKAALHKSATAYIKVLNGEAESEVYTLHSSDGKINIGREKKTRDKDGFFRMNTIAFPATSGNESNKFISRQHAHIQFDNQSGHFLLFADEGGVPPNNKIKVRSLKEDTPVKLYSTNIGHALEEGNQIMLGESAILAFSYLQE